MYRFLVAIAMLTLCVAANAQDWVEHGGAEYNCDVLGGMLADYGDSYLQRSGDRVMTVSELFALFFPSCPQSTDTKTRESPPESDESQRDTVRYVNSPSICTANVRSCPSTACDILQRMEHRQTIGVVTSDNNWSEIRLPNNVLAYIHSDLVSESLPDYGNCDRTSMPSPAPTPQPYGRISANEFYFDSDIEGSETNLNPIKLTVGLWTYEFRAGVSHVILSAETEPEDCAGFIPFHLDTGRERVETNCTVYFTVSNNPGRAGWQLHLYKE